MRLCFNLGLRGRRTLHRWRKRRSCGAAPLKDSRQTQPASRNAHRRQQRRSPCISRLAARCRGPAVRCVYAGIGAIHALCAGLMVLVFSVYVPAPTQSMAAIEVVIVSAPAVPAAAPPASAGLNAWATFAWDPRPLADAGVSEQARRTPGRSTVGAPTRSDPRAAQRRGSEKRRGHQKRSTRRPFASFRRSRTRGQGRQACPPGLEAPPGPEGVKQDDGRTTAQQPEINAAPTGG